MTQLPVTDLAFTGFRIVKERVWALPVWALIALVISLGGNSIIAGMGGKLPDALTLQQNPDLAPALLARLAPTALGLVLLLLVLNAIVYAAMNRAVLRPGQSRWGYVRLGADELRQIGLLLLLTGVFLGVELGLGIIIAIGGALAAPGGKLAAVIVAAVTVATAVCVIVILAVRLSLASAETFDKGKIGLRGSWDLTCGRFWPILGTYLLAVAITAVVAVLAWLVELGVGAAATGGHMQGFIAGQPETLAALFAPVALLRMVLGSMVTALIWPLILTPSAAIYQTLSPTKLAG